MTLVAVVFVAMVGMKLLGIDMPGRKDELTQIVEKVGRHMMLPDNETPTLATVIDKEELTQQGIFVSSENGDKVLIFPKSKLAILYRPSIDKIIEVVDITTNTQDNTPSPTPTRQPSPTPQNVKASVILLNGSATPGATEPIMNTLAERFPEITVFDRQMASHTDYAGILVCPTSPDAGSAAEAIANLLNGKVGDLPDEEQAEADIVIIVGN